MILRFGRLRIIRLPRNTLIVRVDGIAGKRFNCERSGDADFRELNEWLVETGDLLGSRISCDRPERDPLKRFILEATVDTALVVTKRVERVDAAEKSLAGYRQSNAARVNGNPSTTKLLGDSRGCSDPEVGSSIRSPTSVVMRMHRSRMRVFV